MPNIEFHGYQPQDAAKISEEIKKVLHDYEHRGETVFTFFINQSITLSGVPSRHLRVVASIEEYPELERRLEAVKEDAEFVELAKWVPHK